MKALRIILMALCMAAGFLIAEGRTGLGQDAEGEKPAEAEKPAEKKASAEEEFSVPTKGGATPEFGHSGVTPDHQMMDDWQGDWDVYFKLWNPGQEEPTTWKGRAQRIWDMGGRFINEERVDHLAEGQPERRHIYGFDEGAKEYTAILYGEGVSTTFIYRGAFDEEVERFVLAGGFNYQGQQIYERMEITPVVDGVQKVYVYGWGTMPDGTEVDEMLHIEITYVRRAMIGITNESMQRMIADMSPAEPHKELAELVGEWDYKLTVTPKEIPPMIYSGTSTAKLDKDGRFLIEENDAKPAGMGFPFTQTTIHAYDNASEQYQMAFYSSRGTSIMTMDGHKDDQGNVVLIGGYYNSVNERWVPMKSVREPVKEGAFIMSVYFDYQALGVWEPAATMEYTRKE